MMGTLRFAHPTTSLTCPSNDCLQGEEFVQSLQKIILNGRISRDEKRHCLEQRLTSALSQQFHPKTGFLIAQDHAFPDNLVQIELVFHHVTLSADSVVNDNQAFGGILGVDMAGQL